MWIAASGTGRGGSSGCAAVLAPRRVRVCAPPLLDSHEISPARAGAALVNCGRRDGIRVPGRWSWPQ
eukprot:1325036-Pyramimonas_sp.AAC.1